MKTKFLLFSLYVSLILFLPTATEGQTDADLKFLLSENKYQEVINILEEKFTKEDSLSFSKFNMLGNAYQRLMNYRKSITYLYKANILEPNNIQNLILLGNSYDASGDENSAKNTFKKILEIDSTNQISMINLGKILMDLDEYNQASELYKRLIISDSTNAYFLSQLGICELKKGNKEFAKKILTESLQLNINDTKTALILAKLFYNDEQYFDAVNLLQEAIKVNSKNKALNKMLADVFYKSKRYNEAILKYLYCNTIGDTSLSIYQKLGMSYYYLSFTSSYINTETRDLKLQEGVEALKLAVQKDSNDPISYLYLGLCYKELSEDESAIINLEETLNKIFPDYLSEVYYNLGSCYDKVENYSNAIKTYKESLSYNPSRKIIYFYLANLYDRYYADKNVAVLYYQKFVDEDIEADENLVGYSLNRINALSQEAEFWKGKN
ncbi:MAG: tetratricopeptide repeat protein [Ignavibacteriales bacterium]|nr:tetratricopeptide repeat protein [Ignavibacteriales bacterium]MCB9207794.1 tetratricopeptide repeat protein [Ignavibacteriales bacterium]